MAKQRNNIVELARFLFSLLVVGYHIQMTWANGGLQFFAGGALAVEFFFLISGYFLARSVEKVNAKSDYRLPIETGKFMWGKVKGVLPVHVVAIVGIIIVILSTKLNQAGSMILNGLPSVFLVHMAVVWNSSFNLALIIPEWYLSAMLITMLFMFPIGLLLRKKLNGILTTVVLVAIIIAALLICGFATNWVMPQNFIYDLRAWGEMCVGMFAFYLSNYLSKKEINTALAKTLPILEIALYCIPLIFGFIPFPADYAYVTMIIAVVCSFGAISVTFSGKGLQLKDSRLNSAFGYLGSISLAIYLFHPVIISAFEYARIELPFFAYHLIIFPAAIIAAILFNLIKGLITKALKRKEN